MYRHNNDRGQVGIGTLIVFISMVLVAAIAAGVLINTAGFLQTQAEATGEESTAQVSDSVQVMTAVGITNATTEYHDGAESAENWWAEDDPDRDEIVHVELSVQKSPGAGPIDISKATIEYLNDEALTLTHNGTYNAGATDGFNQSNSFLTEEVRGTSGPNVLMADDDRLTVHIPLGDLNSSSAFGDSSGHPFTTQDPGEDVNQPGFIGQGDNVELVLTTAQGSQTPVSLRAPDIIRDEPAVAL
ncbi:archaellin/type IV pilin N-terminal domain-containing protein [Halopiger djelfimassiliensis]|nr:archaellin/type IV pilin N-terminal domain-containing protein [Halopiger djelfimassiliensis]